jgi:hypothetical protein
MIEIEGAGKRKIKQSRREGIEEEIKHKGR